MEEEWKKEDEARIRNNRPVDHSMDDAQVAQQIQDQWNAENPLPSQSFSRPAIGNGGMANASQVFAQLPEPQPNQRRSRAGNSSNSNNQQTS